LENKFLKVISADCEYKLFSAEFLLFFLAYLDLSLHKKARKEQWKHRIFNFSPV